MIAPASSKSAFGRRAREGRHRRKQPVRPTIAVYLRLRQEERLPDVPVWKPLLLLAWAGAVLALWIAWKLLAPPS